MHNGAEVAQILAKRNFLETLTKQPILSRI